MTGDMFVPFISRDSNGVTLMNLGKFVFDLSLKEDNHINAESRKKSLKAHLRMAFAIHCTLFTVLNEKCCGFNNYSHI